MRASGLAESFEEHRAHLLTVAYRLTGSVADAEDAVQDSWLRLATVDAGEIDNLRAWLTTVVGRLCLDKLRSAAVRREKYVGQWLPEPIVTPLGGTSPPDPLEQVVQHEDSRLAALIRWYTPAEAMIMATSTNAELLTLSGLRNPYPGKLGVVEQGAFADLLLVQGDPLTDLAGTGNQVDHSWR